MDAENILQAMMESSLKNIEEEGIVFIRTCMLKFYRIWNVFGIDNCQKEKRLKKVWEYVCNLLQDIFDEEEAYYRKVQENISNYKTLIDQLSKELSVVPQKVTGSLIKTEKLLCKELEMLELLKDQRIKSYKELKSTQSKLCRHMNMKEQEIALKRGLPTEEDFKELEEHVEFLKKEEDQRRMKLCLVKQELINLQNITEWQPNTRLEKEIILEAENVVLSEENLKLLDDVVQKARKQRDDMETQFKTFTQKLISLWGSIEVDKDQREDFLSKHKKCCFSSLKSIQKEIEKCEQKRQETLLIEVESMRKNLDELWENCFVSDAEKRKFYPYFAFELTEDILEAHRAEVEKWKKYHNRVKHILAKITKREELWNRLLSFDNRPMDNSRFQNRKGKLLQEERERKELQKQLPSLENDIFSIIEEYETQNRKEFTYYGSDYRLYISNQWEQRLMQKEEKRHNREEQRKISSTPIKRLLTPVKPTPSKVCKIDSVYCTPQPYKTPVKTNAVRIVRRSTRLNPKFQTQISLSSNNKASSQASLNSTTYSAFVANINSEKKQYFQSSLMGNTKSRHSPSGILRTGKSLHKTIPQKAVALTPSRGTLSRVKQQNIQSSVISTKAKNRNSPKSSSKSASKSMQVSRNSQKSVITPTRGKLGLPFLI